LPVDRLSIDAYRRVPGVACGGPAVDACCAAVTFLAERPRRPGGRVLGQRQAEHIGRETFGPLLRTAS
jgi:hypothetical protein